ncbi:MAG: hypothetical protein CME19_16310 [Gemmatimonadetes bacterium]|nr:hypothetical protein [Gemmatimonadota bacterium]|tara:strand:- start:1242 stop:1754 length:513 start_codon:yes stop_codon:yes gene_type:complete
MALFLLLSALVSATPPPGVEQKALRQELQWAKASEERYYLVLDLYRGNLDLKAGGRLLMRARIQDYSETLPAEVSVFTFTESWSPNVPTESHRGHRLGNRRLPLDFVGRLIEGPTTHDRLLFAPPFLIASDHLPRPRQTPHVTVSGKDLKSISAAIEAGTQAILIALDER